MGDRRVQATRRDAVRGRRITLGVTGPMDVATTDATAREDGREDQRVVAAALSAVAQSGLRSPAVSQLADSPSIALVSLPIRQLSRPSLASTALAATWLAATASG